MTICDIIGGVKLQTQITFNILPKQLAMTHISGINRGLSQSLLRSEISFYTHQMQNSRWLYTFICQYIYIIVFAFFITWIIFFDTFQMYISLHSFGELILYPWSHTKKPIHDWHELDAMARRWSDVVFQSSKGKYKYRVCTNIIHIQI